MSKIESFYNLALDAAITEMEQLAIAAMEENRKLNGFCNGMGEWAFYDKAGSPLDLDNIKPTETISSLKTLYSAWDEYLKISGNPLRIERVNGKLCIEYDW